jgi:hypothetical protein
MVELQLPDDRQCGKRIDGRDGLVLLRTRSGAMAAVLCWQLETRDHRLRPDHQASVASITNSSGGVVVGENFTPFGSRRNPRLPGRSNRSAEPGRRADDCRHPRYSSDSSRSGNRPRAGPETLCSCANSSPVRPIGGGFCVIGVAMETPASSAFGNTRSCAQVHGCAVAAVNSRAPHRLSHEVIRAGGNELCRFANQRAAEATGTLAGYRSLVWPY